jgi:hypothetical protein
MYQRKELKGLIRLRKRGTGKDKPSYHCENCNCNRYSPCTCKRSKNKGE